MRGSVRILHLEDDLQFGELTAECLERADERFEVVTETTPSDALATLDEAPVDCIVSDYDMPGLNGLEFLEAVRERDADLPFILFTGKGSEEVASDAISMGVTDYLQKDSGIEQYTILANRITNAVTRRERERELGRARELLANVELLGDVGAWELDLSTQEVYWTEGTSRIHEVTPEFEPTVENIKQFLHPDDSEKFQTLIEECQEGGDPFADEIRIVTANDEERWVYTRGEFVADSETIRGYIQDVTDRKERETQLQRERDRLEMLFENLPTPVLQGSYVDDELIVERVNPAFEETFGYSQAEIAGESGIEKIVPEDRTERASERIERALAEGSLTARVVRETVDGPREFRIDIAAKDTEGVPERFTVYTELSDREE